MKNNPIKRGLTNDLSEGKKKIMRGNSAPVNSCIEKTQNTKVPCLEAHVQAPLSNDKP